MNKEAYQRKFFARTRLDENGCLIWIGATYGNGYGQAQFRGVRTGAHRIAWMLAHDHLPDDELDHTCNRRDCVNLAHLEPVTHAENRKRARRTHCTLGHEMTERNRTKMGSCKVCQAAYQRERRRQSANASAIRDIGA